ncbi:leucine-rich repeat domain-containing protein [Anatilimnocola sp. NA78]|uniref:leucine-rich repeat domain-containing protein n=1 Tax=Anatilimnocola sp. NA78 TaxID=3415683 RepID=UPI003CE4E1B1
MLSNPQILPFCVLAALCCAQVVRAESPAESLESLDRHFAQQLTTLAEKCDSLKLPEQAALTREWQVPRTAGRQTLFIPPIADPHQPARGAPELVAKWYGKFREVRSEQAQSLYAVAGEFLAAGDAARCYQLLHEVLRENPDHEASRQALGYVRGKGKTDWPPYATVPQANVGRADHPKTGWQSGKYWRVESPHWRIVTNKSAKDGLDLARKLEDFHLLWRQMFFDYWCTAADLQAALTSGVKLPEPKTPMNVILFNKRDEYVKFLAPSRPNIAVTQGFYADDQQTAVFYAGDETIHATWYHEAAHQLFQQWHDSPAGVGENHNFWIVEGAALYVESLTNHGDYWTVGGWQADRLQFARYRALAKDFNKPLQELVALHREQVQADPNIRALYAQFAAEAHFLFDHANPAYRRAGCALLGQVYRQEAKLNSLSTLTQASFSELDQAYLQSLQVTDDDLLKTPGLAQVRNLSLGRTQVTDRGLAALAACRELRWLDLTALPITDAGLAELKQASKLDQLFLEGTKISDASLPLVAQFTSLAELDLSNLPLTEAALASLGKLRKLKILHLTGTPLGDTAIPHLRNLSGLESLNVSGTKLTPAGLQRLKATLPKTTVTQ